jgi:hypothetical protein
VEIEKIDGAELFMDPGALAAARATARGKEAIKKAVRKKR